MMKVFGFGLSVFISWHSEIAQGKQDVRSNDSAHKQQNKGNAYTETCNVSHENVLLGLHV